MSSHDEDAQEQELNRMIKEFFDNGGKVTKFEKYARSEDIEYTVGWGKRRKKTPNSDK